MEHKLVEIGRCKFSEPKTEIIHFVDEKNINDFVNDIENFPHAFVLSCLMDRQLL